MLCSGTAVLAKIYARLILLNFSNNGIVGDKSFVFIISLFYRGQKDT